MSNLYAGSCPNCGIDIDDIDSREVRWNQIECPNGCGNMKVYKQGPSLGERVTRLVRNVQWTKIVLGTGKK